jgi:hypothetical protein
MPTRRPSFRRVPKSEHYTEASAARSLANRQSSLVNEQRLQDITTFDRWLELSVAGNTELVNIYERQFRDEFKPAFDARSPRGRERPDRDRVATDRERAVEQVAAAVAADRGLGEVRGERGADHHRLAESMPTRLGHA